MLLLNTSRNFVSRLWYLTFTEQPKGMNPNDHDDLWKQHKKEDIYRKHYGGTPKLTRRKGYVPMIG